VINIFLGKVERLLIDFLWFRFPWWETKILYSTCEFIIHC